MNNAPKVQEQTFRQTLASGGASSSSGALGSSQGDLAQAVGKMVALKEEHRPIMEQIAKDPGMLPETRLALIDHVLEEEEELVAKINDLVGVEDAGEKIGAGPTRALTVGPMRAEAHDGAQMQSVGSLKVEKF